MKPQNPQNPENNLQERKKSFQGKKEGQYFSIHLSNFPVQWTAVLWPLQCLFYLFKERVEAFSAKFLESLADLKDFFSHFSLFLKENCLSESPYCPFPQKTSQQLWEALSLNEVYVYLIDRTGLSHLQKLLIPLSRQTHHNLYPPLQVSLHSSNPSARLKIKLEWQWSQHCFIWLPCISPCRREALKRINIEMVQPALAIKNMRGILWSFNLILTSDTWQMGA